MVGCGGLGCPVAQYLAAAGIGEAGVSECVVCVHLCVVCCVYVLVGVVCVHLCVVCCVHVLVGIVCVYHVCVLGGVC